MRPPYPLNKPLARFRVSATQKLPRSGRQTIDAARTFISGLCPGGIDLVRKRPGKPARPSKAAFRQDWSIGNASAEADQQLLKSCFFDNGSLAQLSDTESNASIVLGRVGAGKSALLLELERRSQRTVRIDPSLFSIKYISQSSALQFVSALGVKLDPIFQALWKHVLCVEYIRLRYNIKNARDASGIWNQISNYLSQDDVKRIALDYFKEFGGVQFWQTTEVRLKEINQKLERELVAKLNIAPEIISAGASGAKKLSEHQKLEIIDNAKSFVNAIHMSALQNVITALADMDRNNHGAKYYIVIDDLDTDWADTEIRHRLIRALIESIRRFRKIRQLKIVVAMRTDLLESVIETTRDAGLQIEKLEDFFLRVSWTDQELKNLLDLRINEALKQKYTREKVEFFQVFPRGVKQTGTLDYIFEKTLKRPRDIILFINECFKQASGKTDMTPAIIQEAYRNFSVGRRLSMLEEWHDVFPDLKDHLDFFSGWKSRTAVKEISCILFNKQLLKFVGREDSKDRVSRAMASLANTKGDVGSIFDSLPALRPLFMAAYTAGAIGFVFPPAANPVWSGNAIGQVSESAIDLETVVVIHPMIAHALGVNINY